MDRIVKSIDTLSDFKRGMKAFVRGTIKAKVFTPETGKMVFVVEKFDDGNSKNVTVATYFDGNYAEYSVDVPTRVYNKVVPELFTKTIEQFNKLKGFAGMEVKIAD